MNQELLRQIVIISAIVIVVGIPLAILWRLRRLVIGCLVFLLAAIVLFFLLLSAVFDSPTPSFGPSRTPKHMDGYQFPKSPP